MRKGSRWWWTGAAVVATVFVARFVIESEPALSIDESTSASGTPAPKSAAAPNEKIEVASPQARRDPKPSAVGTHDDGHAAFRADTTGELVLDEQTRLNIEALIAHSESSTLYAAVREQTEDLPPAAARRVEELVDKYVSYQQALRQSYPPGEAPPTAEDAVRELEGLHALREAYFGVDVARRFYGNEETLAREMIEVMRVENDPSLTAQEKLERAQALRKQLPGVAEIERRNRDADSSRNRQEEN
jgi:hypothetical protein